MVAFSNELKKRTRTGPSSKSIADYRSPVWVARSMSYRSSGWDEALHLTSIGSYPCLRACHSARASYSFLDHCLIMSLTLTRYTRRVPTLQRVAAVRYLKRYYHWPQHPCTHHWGLHGQVVCLGSSASPCVSYLLHLSSTAVEYERIASSVRS